MTERPARGERPAAELPVARVAVDVAAGAPGPAVRLPGARRTSTTSAVPGVRVRVRFAGRLVDGFVLERRRRLRPRRPARRGWSRVVSPEPVLTAGGRRAVPGGRRPVRRRAGRRAAARGAAPARAGGGRAAGRRRPAASTGPPAAAPATGAVGAGTRAARRSSTRCAGGAGGARGLAGAARRGLGRTGSPRPPRPRAAPGRGALLVVPDQRDVAALHAALHGAGWGERRRRRADRRARARPSATGAGWRCGAGAARVVVGTRAAVFAPVADLGLVAVWDDGDDLHDEPRAPYPHVRDVLVLRAHAAGRGAADRRLRPDGRGAAAGRRPAGRRRSWPTGRRCGPRRRGSRRWARPTTSWPAIPTAPRGPAAGRRVRGGPGRAGRGQAGAGAGARAAGTCRGWPARSAGRPPAAGTARVRWRCRAGPAVRGRRAGAVRRRSAAGAAVRNRRSAARRADRAGCARGVVGRRADRRGAGPGLPRGDGAHVGRQRAGARPACPPGPTWWWPRRAPSRSPRAGTARRCCSTAGRCSSRPDLRVAEETLRRWMAAAALVVPARRRGGRVVVVADAALAAGAGAGPLGPGGHARRRAGRAHRGRVPARGADGVRRGHGAGRRRGRRGPAGPGRPARLGHLLDPRAGSGPGPPGTEVLGPVELDPEPGADPAAPPGNGRCCACPARRVARWPPRWTAVAAQRSARKAPDAVRVRLDPPEVRLTGAADRCRRPDVAESGASLPRRT